MRVLPYQLAAVASLFGLPSEPITRRFDMPYSNRPRPANIPRNEREKRKAAKKRAKEARRRNRR